MEGAMGRRVIERERAGALRAAAPPRVTVRHFGAGRKLNWQVGRRRGFSAHRSFRLSGIGNAIGGQRQRRLRAARSH
jgi:hypothetical protein